MSVGDDRLNPVPAVSLSMAASAPQPAAAAPDAPMSRSIRRHFVASLAERRRLLIAMWESLRSNPQDRATRARLSRHLRVLADAAARAGEGSVESAARAADRYLPQVTESGGVLDPLIDATLDAMAAASQHDAPAIASRLPMVVLDGIARGRLDWLVEILVAAGCQAADADATTEPALPGSAAGHLVLLDAHAATPTRLRQWRECAARSTRPLRLAVFGEAPDPATRLGWLAADAVMPDGGDHAALLAAVEAEVAALEDPLCCVGLLGFDADHADWVVALSAAGFTVASAGSDADAWRIARAGALDAILVGPPTGEVLALEIANLLSQVPEAARTQVIRVGDDDEHARLFACGVARLPGGLPPPAAAAALRERLSRVRRGAPTDLDPISGALRRAPFLLLMQAMLDGPAAFVGIGLIDLDGLRAVNEQRGRAAGDAALRSLARRLRAALPATAVLGRAGSDEFLFGFTARNEAEARRLMAQAASPPSEAEGEPRLAHSIGGVLLDRDDRAQRLPLAELIARAGELMLDAKCGSGSRIALARYGERPIGERWF